LGDIIAESFLYRPRYSSKKKFLFAAPVSTSTSPPSAMPGTARRCSPQTSRRWALTSFQIQEIYDKFTQWRSQKFGLGGAVGWFWIKSLVNIDFLIYKAKTPFYLVLSSLGWGCVQMPHCTPSGYATEFTWFKW